MKDFKKPLIYSCSGCSSAAQLANSIAVKMDRSGIAEMSCIAGVGGDVKPLVKTAKSGRDIIALDGCPLDCVKKTLARHNIKTTHHFRLNEYGVKKVQHGDFEPDDVDRITKIVIKQCFTNHQKI
ncbi:MAG: zinc-binding protein [Calditrichaeota bacterium]|nr:MAG: zinc-binding protein [Calditrichota bacterium]MBL1207528.1 zinc-binding protein [Calditrichota bacterium]NOG47360.1 zinc-binding protein [Calditrichota bacterium]